MSKANSSACQHPRCSSEVTGTEVASKLAQMALFESLKIYGMMGKRHQSAAVQLQAFRAYVEKNGHVFDDPKVLEPPKCNFRAAALRREGNELYAKRQLTDAMMKYNESICAATADSEDLGMGYANRSAIFVEQSRYEVALANIALAKKHNYPDRLMAKLLERERRAKHEAANSKAKQKLSLSLNVETNPKIPFLANGIRAQQHPTRDHIVVADQDFKVGDVILHEKPLGVCVGWDFMYMSCNRCLAYNIGHLIPCPNCASAMFCNEECIREGHRLHRFECGISSELCMTIDWLAPRMFFHGLSLFDDNIQKMMEFCSSAKGTGGSFFNLNYSDYDALEEFKAFLTSQPRARHADIPMETSVLQYKAAVYFAMYKKVPLVRSLIKGKAQEKFMLQCFLDYQIIKRGFLPMVEPMFRIYPFASGFSHSCDPKTIVLQERNVLKIVVTRPIRRNERIDIAHAYMCDPEFDEDSKKMQTLKLQCAGDCCDQQKRKHWLAKTELPSSIDPIHWKTLNKILEGDAFTCADKLNALQQFIQRFASHYPQKDFLGYVELYGELLQTTLEGEVFHAETRKIMG